MNIPVMVCEAQAIGMIGVIRSLGRAGYQVHAISQNADALGYHSKYAFRHQTHPNYGSSNFLDWLEAYVSAHSIQCIIPSEGFLLAIKNHYERFAHLMPDSPGRECLYRSFSKADVQETFLNLDDRSLLDRMPKGMVVTRSNPTPNSTIHTYAWPVYVKTDGAYADHGSVSGVHAVDNLGALPKAISNALSTHSRCIIQETVRGVKATVNLWRHDGRVQADSMCVAMHENPHTGGLTSYRRVWWHEAMRVDAQKRLEALDWQGVAMVEYKWDERTQNFWFIEMNSRYWNALNLDLLSGKDFPAWQVNAFFRKHVVENKGPGQLGFRARYTVPADLGHLISRIRDPRIRIFQKARSLFEFFWLGVNPVVHSDLWYPKDTGLYWRAWQRFFRQLLRGQ